MNKISTLLVVTAILLIACKNSKESEIPPEVTLDVSASEWTVSPQKDTILLDIKSNSSWQILQGNNWCQVIPSNGMGDATVQIIVESNDNMTPDAPMERTAQLKLVAGNNAYSKDTTLRITQSKSIFSISADGIRRKAAGQGDTLILDIQGNIPWRFESESDWCTFVPAKGTGDASVQVIVAPNNSYDTRGARIRVRTTTPEYVVGYSISQAGKKWNIKMQVEVAGNPDVRNQILHLDLHSQRYWMSGTIDWGDGSFDAFQNTLASSLSHNYINQTATYLVNIQGSDGVPVQLQTTASPLYSTRITSLYIDNRELATLKCDNHLITSLDVSASTQLQTLFCKGNKLTALDVSQNPQLKYLYCSDNELTSLHLNTNSQLQTLSCYGNKFTPEAMNLIYQNLPKIYKDDPEYKIATIEVDGVNAGDYSMAEQKGWKVILH